MDDASEKITRYQMLLDCFRSGQISAWQMQQHMDEDPGFRTFMTSRVMPIERR